MNSIQKILDVMARLRDPHTGCPWDLEQDFSTIAPYTIEEAYEVADAIERNDLADLRDELGDLLFQVVFHARLAEESGHFGFDDVANGIADKMIRRHPHVFADGPAQTAAGMPATWEAQKASERRADASLMDGVARNLPALSRASKLSRRAASVGFDWPDVGGVQAKLDEELAELRACAPDDRAGTTEEVGDLLFTVASLARHLGVDPEAALTAANRKFERRFRHVEAEAAPAPGPADADELARMEAAWQAAKRLER